MNYTAQWGVVENVNTFLRSAALKFDTPQKPISILLNQLRLPPLDMDISHPSSEVRTALQAVGCLACYAEPAHPLTIQTKNNRDASRTALAIETNWASCIGVWVMFYIDKFLLADTEPSTPQGQETLDVIAYVIPSLLMHLASHPDPEKAVQRLKSTSQEFLTVVTRTMLTVLEKYHFTWSNWCAAVAGMQYYSPSDRDDFTTAMIDAAVKWNQDVALIYVKHLHRECQRAFTLPHTIDFQGMRCFILLFTACIHPSSPLHMRFIFHSGVKNLVRLLIIMCRRKTLRHIPPNSSDFEDAYAVINLLASHLEMAFAGSPRTVCDVLDGGLIRAILKANRFYKYEVSHAPRAALSEVFTRVLERIATFFVYPSVLHRFLNIVRKVEESGLENKLKTESKPLLDAWYMCKVNAHEVHAICNTMKGNGVSRCGYSQCPMQSDSTGHDRYYLCSACKTITYCSEECAKKSWNDGHDSHRVQCEEYVESNKAGRGQPTHLDTVFHNELARTFLCRHKLEIHIALRRFTHQNTKGFWTSAGAPRSVLVLDFCRPGFLSMNALNVVKLEQFLAGDKRLENLKEQVELIRKFDIAAARQCAVTVVTFVPAVGAGYGANGAWPGVVTTFWDPNYPDEAIFDSQRRSKKQQQFRNEQVRLLNEDID
ncbi:hypothetical protein Moror_595 [Moniliophthora roreri MCA 2997]|uniref:MYND-type domain-containing protein n=2 Tax=Moniliophthora roreri TaxID=221103 RepID=V2WD49_MONRO|nr:hypothetical protein Moror_595 [Moniliophthora roreri MCA 2997]KAI3619552.1 hypothetical protein WG66_010677 [Moniliophthora roreri]